MKKKRIIAKLFLLTQICSFWACGLYKAPLAPEYFAPLEVNELLVAAEDQKVIITWRASEQDRRNENLKQIDGYRVERKGPIKDTNKKSEFDYEELTFIPDQHLAIERELKDQAIEKGEISRKVKAEDRYYSFSFEDSKLEKGATYFYKITPINQGDVKGQVKQLIVIEFNGIESKVILIEPDIEELEQ